MERRKRRTDFLNFLRACFLNMYPLFFRYPGYPLISSHLYTNHLQVVKP